METLALRHLQSLGKRYLWWMTPEEVAAHPDRLIAQIMDIGTWDDWVTLEREVAVEHLRAVLRHAEPGQFSARSWQFWHLRLHLAELDRVPALLRRSFE